MHNRIIQCFAVLCGLVTGTTGATVTVSPSLALWNWAQHYCPEKKVKSCDIGNGEISPTQTATQFQRQTPLKIDTTNLVAGRNLRFLSDCSEAKDSCQHIDSSYFWCHYQQNKCMSKYISSSNEQYSNLKVQTVDDQWAFVSYVDNDTNDTQTQTLTRSETTTDTYTWTLTTEVDVGFSMELLVGVPLQFSEKQTFSILTKSTRTNTTTKTKTQQWTLSQKIDIPARTTVKVEMLISAVEATGDFSATIEFPDYAHVWCNKKTNGHYEWFVPASSFMPQAYPGICSGNKCNIGGPFSGVKGVESIVKLSYCPLNVHC